MSFAVIWMGVVVLVAVIGFLLTRQWRDSAWRQLAADLGAEFTEGGFMHSGKVQARMQQWTVTLDAYSVPSGDSSTTYTRMRAPFENKDGFDFAIFREGLVSRLDKKLGMADIEIGVPDFDHDFVIQSNNGSKVRALLADAKIRQLIQAQPRIRLAMKGSELHFEAQGVIRDVPRLKSLFELFRAVLEQLER
jgi:hypothetical protein